MTKDTLRGPDTTVMFVQTAISTADTKKGITNMHIDMNEMAHVHHEAESSAGEALSLCPFPNHEH